jgi:hypothetical protein
MHTFGNLEYPEHITEKVIQSKPVISLTTFSIIFQYLSGFLDPPQMTIENWHEAILFAKMEIRRPSMM